MVRPNTTSPPVPLNCKPFESHLEDSISGEMKEELMMLLESEKEKFQTIGSGDDSREALYYGDFQYKYRGVCHDIREIPAPIKKLIDTIKSQLPEEALNKELNTCLINRYRNGSSIIPQHRDNEPVIDPESLIVTVSLGGSRTMAFQNNDNSLHEQVTLKDGSSIICSRFSQDFWLHEILPEEGSDEERFSLTLRHISPSFINSTIILGDSNTQHIKFGTEKGTLGPRIPGKRVKVGHIEALPPATEIGPYRNIVIHTGINSLSSRNYSRPIKFLVQHLEMKCKEYLSVYPRSNIYVSLALPTKLKNLNFKVRDFNNFVMDMTYGVRNLFVLDQSMFGDHLEERYGRFDGTTKKPLTSDYVHLGKLGIRLFANQIKQTILRRRSESQSRFKGGSGQYAAAVSRGTELRDGYQP